MPRSAVRFRPIADRYAIIRNGEEHLANCKVENISSAGVCLEVLSGEINENHKNHDLKLLFKFNNKNPSEHDAKIVREDETHKWIGMSFNGNEITREDLIKIRGQQSSSYEIAKLDKTTVLKESLQIKICSSNYFIWTVGLLIPSISAIWTLFVQNKISPGSCSGAMLAMFVIFCMSAFSNLEKSRAINKREGFVAALDNYLVNGIAPANYKGWANLKHAYAECPSKCEAGICPKGIPSNSKKVCKYVGRDLAKINNFKKIVPSILDSFVALTSVFYSIVFIIIAILCSVSILNMLSDLNIPTKTSIFLLVFGFSLGFFILGRNTKLFFTILFLTSAIFALNFANPTYHLNIHTFSVENVFIKLIVLFVSYIFGSVGNILTSHYIRLRKREYSIESQYFMWLEILDRCIFMPDYEITSEPIRKERKLNSIIDPILNWIFLRKSHAR